MEANVEARAAAERKLADIKDRLSKAKQHYQLNSIKSEEASKSRERHQKTLSNIADDRSALSKHIASSTAAEADASAALNEARTALLDSDGPADYKEKKAKETSKASMETTAKADIKSAKATARNQKAQLDHSEQRARQALSESEQYLAQAEEGMKLQRSEIARATKAKEQFMRTLADKEVSAKKEAYNNEQSELQTAVIMQAKNIATAENDDAKRVAEAKERAAKSALKSHQATVGQLSAGKVKEQSAKKDMKAILESQSTLKREAETSAKVQKEKTSNFEIAKERATKSDNSLKVAKSAAEKDEKIFGQAREKKQKAAFAASQIASRMMEVMELEKL